MTNQKKILDIIIPTWNNPQYLNACVTSIRRLGVADTFGQIIVVNNGDQPCQKQFMDYKGVTVLNPGKNLGWEGGLKLGLEQSESDFVCFMNDDTFIPQSSSLFFQRLLLHFIDKKVAAVGPLTTIASGCQSIYANDSPLTPIPVSWLIFFCAVIRRSALNSVGGIDTSLPGGDDFDLCIRLRQAGFRIVADPGAFLIHHAFVTGNRVRGDRTVKGGWNSEEMISNVNTALIRKHGFKAWFDTMSIQILPTISLIEEDYEGKLISSMLNGEKKIVELGCGDKKTVTNSIGVDRIPNGESIPNVGSSSVADVVSDVTDDLPFESDSQDVVIARHILEHCLDPIDVLRKWRRIIKPGGKLIIAVPDECVTSGIPLNPEHVHAYNESSLKTMLEVIGMKHLNSMSCENKMSFIGVYEK